MTDCDFSRLSSLDLPFDVNLLPPQTCLVGGAVRDALLAREGDYLDLDLVLPTAAVETAQQIARQYRAGFVILDQERQIARIVFEGATVDFALQEGASLEIDLRRRDFTINAIAYDLATRTLIDPLGGREDLERRMLKMVAPANLKDDPLRLLRAYRQAAQLDFAIEVQTATTISELAPLVATVAVERVQSELNYLLTTATGSYWLKAAWQAGLIEPWLAEATETDLDLVAGVDHAVQQLGATWSEFAAQIRWSYLAKLACLVSPEPIQAELELIKLKYSRADIKAVVTARKNLPRLLEQLAASMSLREQYFFFIEVGEVFPVLAILTTTLEGNQEAIAQRRLRQIAPLIERYFNPQDPVAHPQPLVTGNDLLQTFNLKPSPLIGKLLTQIQLATIEGKISTRQEALEFAASLLPPRRHFEA